MAGNRAEGRVVQLCHPEPLNRSRNAYIPADRRQTDSLRRVFHMLTIIKLAEIQEGRSNYLLHRR
jgi:hypothetical protein